MTTILSETDLQTMMELQEVNKYINEYRQNKVDEYIDSIKLKEIITIKNYNNDDDDDEYRDICLCYLTHGENNSNMGGPILVFAITDGKFSNNDNKFYFINVNPFVNDYRYKYRYEYKYSVFNNEQMIMNKETIKSFILKGIPSYEGILNFFNINISIMKIKTTLDGEYPDDTTNVDNVDTNNSYKSVPESVSKPKTRFLDYLKKINPFSKKTKQQTKEEQEHDFGFDPHDLNEDYHGGKRKKSSKRSQKKTKTAKKVVGGKKRSKTNKRKQKK